MTHFNEHSSFAIRQAIEPLLAQHGIRLIVQSVDYATGTRATRAAICGSAARQLLPLEFSLFATLYELPLVQLRERRSGADAALWRANCLPLAEYCQRHGQQTTSCIRCSTTGRSCTASAACAACG
ncbi:hypothetical protein M8494_23980 [Serratia ureilytica]